MFLLYFSLAGDRQKTLTTYRIIIGFIVLREIIKRTTSIIEQMLYTWCYLVLRIVIKILSRLSYKGAGIIMYSFMFLTDRQTDISNYIVASLLKIEKLIIYILCMYIYSMRKRGIHQGSKGIRNAWHSTWWTNQSKFNISPQSCTANE